MIFSISCSSIAVPSGVVKVTTENVGVFGVGTSVETLKLFRCYCNPAVHSIIGIETSKGLFR